MQKDLIYFSLSGEGYNNKLSEIRFINKNELFILI
ncbi:hypothetical protein PEDI_33070 [Persicobacter diffluens]|uniref:Uncharacterized protein n=1 Tax=Persicobacter diffluens TaxID=981 RepID=A0AAN5AKD9_9BACT|nr:hypothetical protein PEDI_33070 [Persicobacter diffluens]